MKHIEEMSKKKFTYTDRLTAFNDISDSLDVKVNGDKLCVSSNKKMGNAIKMSHRFGSASISGEAWIGFTLNNEEKVAVKKIPLQKYDQNNSFTLEQLNSGDSAWAEMTAYMLCNVLLLAKVVPNLPFLYKFFWCPACNFENKQIRKKVQPCLLVVNELADIDLIMFLRKNVDVWNSELVENCIFQLATALYALEKFYKITHNDLHDGNVLVHKVEPGGFWHYKIDSKNYYLPNLGYVFVLWDFGMVHIPGKIKGRPEFQTMDSSPIPTENDLGRIAAAINELLRKKRAIKYMGKKIDPLLKKILRDDRMNVPLKDTIKDFTHLRKSKPSSDMIIDSYNLDVTKATLKKSHTTLLAQFLAE